MAYTPNPGSNGSGSSILNHLSSYYLRRVALDQLRPIFRFYNVCEPDVIPERNGKTITWYRYTNMAAATAGVSEGQVGTSLAMTPSKTITKVCLQYADFITTSDVLRDTAVDSNMEYLARELGFRAGYTVDNVTRAVIDAETSAAQTALSTYLTAKDFRACGFILQGRNVRPMADGLYSALIHPYIAFDVVNDPSANGLADIYKYTAPEKAAGVRYADRDQVAVVGNCKIVQSTNVKKTTGSPNQWRTYVFGKGAVGCASLAGYEIPSNVTDPNKQTFAVKSRVLKDVELANPTGQIGGFVSYNFMHVTAVLEGPSGIGGLFRYMYIDTPSSIVS